jgi:SAM-dependent methyltransferase
MNNLWISSERLETPCFDSVPLELHGHRKKLKFIWGCIAQYRHQNGLSPNQIRVLEVGCSNGRNIAMPLAECGYRITGIDLHLESIAYAQAHNRLGNARFLCQDLCELRKDEEFEIVVLSDILEHVMDPAHICRTAMQYLAKDGLVLISVPNGFGPYELEQRFMRVARLNPVIDFTRTAINRLLRRRIGGPAYNHDSGHIQFFHLNEFRRLLDHVGLKVLGTSNGALFGGTLSYALANRLSFIVAASLALADRLPQRWVSTWYYCCSLREKSEWN